MIVEWIVGVVSGLLSGCGVGGGTLLLLYLTAVAGMEQRLAAGVNLLYFLCCTPTALISHIRHKLVDFRTFWPAAVAGMVSAAVAAFSTEYLSTDLLRRGFGVMLIYVGFKSLFGSTGRPAFPRRK